MGVVVGQGILSDQFYLSALSSYSLGAFGKVLKGKLMTGEEEQKVAIKTLKSECIN